MERNLVQVARIRMREVVPGDVVNRLADEPRGWFAAAIVEELFDGDLAVSNTDRTKTFSAGPFDIIGVQMLKPLDIPALEGVDVEGETNSAANPEDESSEDQEQPVAEVEQEKAPVSAQAAPTPDPEREAEVSRARQALAARMGQG